MTLPHNEHLFQYYKHIFSLRTTMVIYLPNKPRYAC